MKPITTLRIFGIVGAFAYAGSVCKAQFVAYEFAGTITFRSYDAIGELPVDIVKGTPFTGSVSFDIQGLTDSDPALTDGVYNFAPPLQNNFYMSVSINDHVIESTPSFGFPYNAISIVDRLPSSGYGDRISHIAYYPTLDGHGLFTPGVQLRTTVSFVFNESRLSNDAITTYVPDTTQALVFFSLYASQDGRQQFNVQGEITSLTVVPEPKSSVVTCAALALLAMGPRLLRMSRIRRLPASWFGSRI